MIFRKDLLDLYIPETVRGEIARLSQIDLDLEYCGIVRKIGDDFIAELMPNSSEESECNFRIDSKNFQKYVEDGSLYAIWHTHYKDDSESLLSFKDIEGSKHLGVPYILYHKGFKEWDFYDPKNFQNPFPLYRTKDFQSLDFYKNYPFRLSRLDCYELVRVFYKGFLDIEIRDYTRPLSVSRIETEGWDEFSKELPKRGFIEVFRNKPKKFDLVVMRANSGTPSHIGVMVSDREILHIPDENSVSEIVIYGSDLEDRTVKLFAHMSLVG